MEPTKKTMRFSVRILYESGTTPSCIMKEFYDDEVWLTRDEFYELIENLKAKKL